MPLCLTKKREPVLRSYRGHIRHHIGMLFAPRSSFWQHRVSPMTLSPPGWTHRARLSANGVNAFSSDDSKACKSFLGKGVQSNFPPQVMVEVKALACELPYIHGIPLSRFSINDIHREVLARGIVAQISGSTLWRWLHSDAIRPWYYRSWIFPRDPAFMERATPVLDLYESIWEGKPLGKGDFVLSADEKTSIQARNRSHPTVGPSPGKSGMVEHEYRRKGALNYLAVWDVHRGKVFGRVEPKTGIKPFMRLVDQVMNQEPYRSASRVFWIVDNGSSHRGKSSIERLQKAWPQAVLIHLPVHASWLNQIEIYFSIVQRKVLTPNHFESLAELEDRLINFQDYYEKLAEPFKWKFTRQDLANLMKKFDQCANQKIAA